MYKCICGKEFEKKQSYIAHCGHCDFHLNEDQKLKRLEKMKKFSEFSVKSIKDKSKKFHELKEKEWNEYLNNWIKEEHKCENCNKIMTNYYGSGRFCSEQCSRSYSSKIAKKNKDSFKAFSYGTNRDKISPYEEHIMNRLLELNIKFIHNATRKKYTNIVGPKRYVLDFYLPDYKIDLEYDGRFHKDKIYHDNERDKYLNSIGIKVYRIKDYDTNKSLDELFDEFIKWLNY